MWSVPAVMVLVSRRQWLAAWVLGPVFAAGSERGVVLQRSQESLTLLQQVASATYVAAGSSDGAPLPTCQHLTEAMS